MECVCRLLWRGALIVLASAAARAGNAAPPHAGAGCPRAVRLLKEGKDPVRVVCFGDSITGVYYHSGAARAWCDMVGIGLRRLYPRAKLEMANAGISSQTSANGLARIQADVLDRKPDLVVVAFGMNDIRGSNPMGAQASRDNQTQIVQRCRAARAEVVLCTPTSVYHGYPEWPFERLAPYAEIVRQVGAEQNVPVADVYRAFEGIRARDATAWMLLMSEWIHPNMNGHKVIAQEVIRAATGRRVSLADVPAPVPGIPFTLAKLAKREAVRVIAMAPFDTMIEAALRELDPAAQVEVTPWPTDPASLSPVLSWGAGIRDRRPDLVVVAIPAAAGAPTVEQYIRDASEVYNCATSYVTRQFDCVGILPSVVAPKLSAEERRRQDLAREIIRGHDLAPVERRRGDTSSTAAILARWLRDQVEAGRSSASTRQ